MKNTNETKANENQAAAEIRDEALDAVSGGIKKKIETVDYCSHSGSTQGSSTNGWGERWMRFGDEDD